MSEANVLVREMGCTEADFMRWLPGATRHAPVETMGSAEGTLHRIGVQDGMVEILMRPAPPRRIGIVVLPVLEVRFRFLGMNEAQRDAFLAYFDHYTRRGGG